jgi:hypothetical protein
VTVKKVYVSEGLLTIEGGAFKDCKSLESISLPDTLLRIGSPSSTGYEGAFEGTGLHSINIPENVYYLGPCSFFNCTNLASVNLSDKISKMNRGTFQACSSLSTIRLPAHLRTIEEDVFAGCKNLRDIHIPMGTQIICKNAFRRTLFTSIYIPPTVKQIGEKTSEVGTNDETLGYITPHLTVYCTAGSVAMEYARMNKIKCAKATF